MTDFYYDQFDSFCKPSNLNFIESLVTAQSNLLTNDFVHFDLNLPNDDLAIFNQIESRSVNDSCSFDRCLNCNDEQEAIQALADCIAKDSINESSVIKKAAKVVAKIANDIKFALGKPDDYLLVQFRTSYTSFDSTPNETQDWHTDSLFNDLAQRTIITFKGNPTDFYQLTSDERVDYNDYDNDNDDAYIRLGPNFLQNCINPNLISNAKAGQGTIFINLADKAAVHAVPKIGGEAGSTRIVLIVDVANKETIELLNSKLIDEDSSSHFINLTPNC